MPTHVTTQAEDLLLVEATDGIATVTLNRPGQSNALSSALIDQMQSTLDRMAVDSAVRSSSSRHVAAASARVTTSRRFAP